MFPFTKNFWIHFASDFRLAPLGLRQQSLRCGHDGFQQVGRRTFALGVLFGLYLGKKGRFLLDQSKASKEDMLFKK